MPWYFWIPLVVAGLASMVALSVLTAKIQPPPSAAESITLDGKARKLEGERYIEYRVGCTINAPPEAVWALLTNATNLPQWNSTIISVEGTIAAGQRIKLKSKLAPDRVFPLVISTFEPNRRLVWEDGNKIFKGVRTFTLESSGDTTTVTMAEVLTGAFLPQIAPKLPDFTPSFELFAADLKAAAQA
ncbi:SRPBCC domain-containing protein [Enhygromyxa salina]|uniref:SRPBCC domain-containing protein n=1 Tax=Enhygromyxa salina TaxID=215803 RepID=UPI0011B1EC47|nr:SRPBCC domain-containing protein [Enhygromyxa salina]